VERSRAEARQLHGTWRDAVRNFNSRSTALGPNGEIAWRSGWKFPAGTTEVKAFLSAIFGSKPGYANPWVTPGGHKVLLPDNTYSSAHPSGATPGSRHCAAAASFTHLLVKLVFAAPARFFSLA
jgi:hypothetical protein